MNTNEHEAAAVVWWDAFRTGLVKRFGLAVAARPQALRSSA